ncbi:MAG TPA: SCO family protein [Thermodesulfobacteriota bacterium]
MRTNDANLAARLVAAGAALGLLLGAAAAARAHGSAPHGPAAHAPASGAIDFPGGARFDFEVPAPGTYRLPVIREAADGAVLDARGKRRRLRQVMDGRITVLSFVYTRCADPNGCPLATSVLHRVLRASLEDAELARHLKLVTLSFDPEHDTPAVMARYAGPLIRGGAPWEFLTTASPRDVAPILRGYGQVVDGPSRHSPLLTHLLRVYLIDAQGRVRNIYGLDFLDPRLVLADVRTLLLEAGELAAREARR